MTSPLPRVVQVGFNKCATRSLTNLFAGSGHLSAHHKFKHLLAKNQNIALMMRENIKAGRKVFDGFDHHVFYADLMWQSKSETYEAFKDFRRILSDYPDTILLLNIRGREAWIKSRVKHGHGTFLAMVMQAEGFASEAECLEFWRQDWEAHLADVRAFMASKPTQLVEFNSDTQSVDELVAMLPAYHLDAQAWGDVGRSRGRKLGLVGAYLKRLNARRKMR